MFLTDHYSIKEVLTFPFMKEDTSALQGHLGSGSGKDGETAAHEKQPTGETTLAVDGGVLKKQE
jgi:hypothetical protein